MHAEFRYLQTLLGSGFHAEDTWDYFVRWRQSTGDMDLQCAVTFQFLTVFAFALLCSKHFRLDTLAGQVIEKELQIKNKFNELAASTQGNDERLPPQSELEESLRKANDDHAFALQWAGLQGIGF